MISTFQDQTKSLLTITHKEIYCEIILCYTCSFYYILIFVFVCV